MMPEPHSTPLPEILEPMRVKRSNSASRVLVAMGWIAVGIVFGGMAVAPFLPCQ